VTDDPYRSKKSVVFLALGTAVLVWFVYRVLRGAFAAQTIFRAAAREAGRQAGNPRAAFLAVPAVVLVCLALVFLAAVVLAVKSRFDHRSRSRGPL
jgi:hypothetical protein